MATQADLENRIGARAVAQFCDDDGDGAADTAVVTALLAEGDAYTDTLLSSFPSTELTALKADKRVIGATCDIVAGLMGERRQELARPDGRYPYAERMARGREALKAIVTGRERLGVEPTAGVNRTMDGTGVQLTTSSPILVDGAGDF